MQLAKLRHRFASVPGEPYNRHVRLELQHRSEAVPDHGMIFGDHNTYGLGHGLRHSGP